MLALAPLSPWNSAPSLATATAAPRGGRLPIRRPPCRGARLVVLAAAGVGASLAQKTRRDRRGPKALDRRRPKALDDAVQILVSKLQVSEMYAERLIKDIRKFAVARDGDDATGSRSMAWTKKLCRGLEMHRALEPLLRHVGGVEKVLLELEKRSSKHSEVFRNLAQQHQALRDGEEIDMEEYSKDAEYMGSEWWVRASHQRIIDRIDQYYLLSADQMHRGHPPWVFCLNNRLPKGWREYNFQGKTMYWNPEKKQMQKEMPSDLGPLAQPPKPVEPPVKLLDIGSSINRFKDWPFYVEAEALDLQPAAEDVYQADFFELPIVEASEGESSNGLCVKDGKLEGIVAKSFDVVVLSLVLSFLPSPEKRIEMVAKARRCLRDERGLLFVVEGGSAIMQGNWYKKDAAAEWSTAMETAGFKVMNFESQLREGRRFKPVLQWTLETKAIDEKAELQPLVVSKELEW